MATDKEYQALIDSLSGECERLHKENEELKALSQEPCDDVVSRQAVLQAVSEGCFELRGVYGRCEELINALPSVTQKSGKWIPVSEPPKELGTYLIQTDGEPYMCQCRWTDVNPFWTYLKTKPHWNIFDLPQYSKVVAWMPLPEPYKVENEDGVCKDCYYNDGKVHAECVLCDKVGSEE